MEGPRSTQPKAYYMHLLLGLTGKKNVFLSTTKSSHRGEPTVPPLSTQWKNKVQILKALGGKRLPESVIREKPNGTMLTHQRAHTNLPEAYFLTVPHLLEVPEERLVTFLTGVTIQPLRGLQHTHTNTKWKWATGKQERNRKQENFQWSLEAGQKRCVVVRQYSQLSLI